MQKFIDADEDDEYYDKDDDEDYDDEDDDEYESLTGHSEHKKLSWSLEICAQYAPLQNIKTSTGIVMMMMMMVNGEDKR